MDTQANYQLVGLFVVVSILAFVGALFWLANVGDRASAKYYSVYFREHSLSGLQKDSYVTMKGVTVGSVKNYRISPDNIEEVQVTLQLDDSIPVKTTSRAVITRNLLTGIAAVELTGGGQSDPELEGGTGEAPYPIIPEGTSPLEQITDSIPELLEEVGGLAKRVEAFASEENIKAWTNILQQLEKTTAWLAESQGKIDGALTQLNTTGKDISKAAGELSHIASGTDEKVAEVVEETKTTLKQISTTFEEMQVQTRAVSTSLTNASQVFSQQVTSVGQSVSEAAESFSKTVEGFEDPRTLITGPRQKALGPGESLPK